MTPRRCGAGGGVFFGGGGGGVNWAGAK
jgi:hypothetical protein